MDSIQRLKGVDKLKSSIFYSSFTPMKKQDAPRLSYKRTAEAGGFPDIHCAGVHSLVLTMTLSSLLICGAGKCGWEKIGSKCFFLSERLPCCWCWFILCRQTLNPSSAVVHLGTCGFSGRLRTLRQANNRCSLPADGVACLDFHTYTSWWSNHQPEVATLQKLCSLITPVVCTGWVESNHLTSEVLRKFAQMSVLYRLIFIDSGSHFKFKSWS